MSELDVIVAELLRLPEMRGVIASAVLDDGCETLVAGLDELNEETIAGLVKLAGDRDKLCKRLRGWVTLFGNELGCDRDVTLELLGSEVAKLDEQRPVSRLHSLLVALDEQAMARGGKKERDRVRALIRKHTGYEPDTLRSTLSEAKKKLGHR